jgi:hypothetical protein
VKLKNGNDWIPTGLELSTWKEAYPAIDVLGELRKMTMWLEANPSRRKTERGMPRFCVNWLNRAVPERRTTRSTTLAEDLNDTSWAN